MVLHYKYNVLVAMGDIILLPWINMTTLHGSKNYKARAIVRLDRPIRTVRNRIES